MELLDIEKIQLFLVLAVPGIVIIYVRSQFLTGRMLSLKEGLITYIAVSLVYYAIVFPAWALSGQPTGLTTSVSWFLIVLVGPAVAGLLLGLNARKGWLQKLVERFGISTVHPIGTAWDWRFSNINEYWVLAVLKDDTKWAGYLDTNSFISSDPSERDIYINQVYELDADNNWLPRTSGVWIAHGEIQSLEFWPGNSPKGQEEVCRD